MMIVLSREQAAEVRLLADDLDLTEDEVVRHLLSEPLSRWDGPIRVALGHH